MLREELSNFSSQSQFSPINKNINTDINIDDGNDSSIDDNDNDNENNENNEKNEDLKFETLSHIIKNKENIDETDPVIMKENNDKSPTIIKEEEEEENLNNLNDKLNEIVKNENNIQEELNKFNNEFSVNNEELSMSEKFPLSDDPTDDQIEKACGDIVVNDITMPVDIPGETSINPINDTSSNPVVEIKYDNADITNDKKESVDEDKLKKFMTNMQAPSEEVNVVKSGVIATPIETKPISQPSPPSFSFDNLYSNMNNNSDTNKQDTNKSDTPKPDAIKPLELIEGNKSLNNPIIDKGIKVETNNDKMFTLFDYSNEVEE